MQCISYPTLIKAGIVLVILFQIVLFSQTDKTVLHLVLRRSAETSKFQVENITPNGTNKPPLRDLGIGTVSRLVAVVGSNYHGESLVLRGLKRPYVFLVPHFMNPVVNTIRVLPRKDRTSLARLVEFLIEHNNAHGAFGLPRDGRFKRPRDGRFQRTRATNSTPCYMTIRNRSILVWNTDISHKRHQKPSFQVCNFTDGAILLKRRVFKKEYWNNKFGQLSFLDFVLNFDQQLRLINFPSSVFTEKTFRKDRGAVRYDRNFPDYAQFGTKHDVLRIIYEDRIEWTQCVAHWSLCKEEPLTTPRNITEISMPLCCSQTLNTLLTDIVRALIHFNRTHRIIYGTLLGGVRNKAVTPWTYDIDIGLTETDYFNDTMYEKMQEFLNNRYWLGYSYMDTYRAHPMFPPEIKANLTHWLRFDQGGFFHEEVIEAMDILHDQLEEDWRSHCYVDFYPSPSVWLNGSASVTINGRQYVTLPEIEYELKNWYGKDYHVPIVDENWVGMTDKGAV